jgi:hypothetical protein
LHAGQSAAGGQAAPAAQPGAAAPVGDVNQVMRAIFFPNSNVIFNVQVEDPGAERPPQKNEAGKFSITGWGDNLYTRWEVVSYAAVALEESASLLTRQNRRCQNGKLAPVGEAEWRKFTAELADTARTIYAASQAKDRDKVSELTERLNEACASCHRVYRRGPDVDRCVAKQ